MSKKYTGKISAFISYTDWFVSAARKLTLTAVRRVRWEMHVALFRLGVDASIDDVILVRSYSSHGFYIWRERLLIEAYNRADRHIASLRPSSRVG